MFRDQIRIAKIKKNQLEFSFHQVGDVPFEYSFEIRKEKSSCMGIREGDEQSVVTLYLEHLGDWDIFLRNELFLSLLSLSSQLTIYQGTEYVRKQIEEIFKGLDIKLKWHRGIDNLSAQLSKVILFKQDLTTLQQLHSKQKLDIYSMSHCKRQNAFKYVRCLGLKTIRDTDFSPDIANTILRLEQIFKETSADDRFKRYQSQICFGDIEREIREVYLNSLSVDSQTEGSSRQAITHMLQQQFADIDAKMERRELNLARFGGQLNQFIQGIIQGADNKEKVQTLMDFLLQKVIRFFRLKPEEICWSGLPTVRESAQERSSRSRDYDDHLQQKEQLRQTILDLQSQVQKYKKQIEAANKPRVSTPNIFSLRPSLTKQTKFSKQVKSVSKEGLGDKEKQKILRFKTGTSSRSSLTSTTSLTANKSSANLGDKPKKLAACLNNPTPLLEMKMNKTMNMTSTTKTPKTGDTPKSSLPKTSIGSALQKSTDPPMKLPSKTINRQSGRLFK